MVPIYQGRYMKALVRFPLDLIIRVIEVIYEVIDAIRTKKGE